MYYMRSEYGTMTIRQSNYSNDIVVETAVSSIYVNVDCWAGCKANVALQDSIDGLEKHGSINCDPATSNCLAFGSLYLRSNLGDVEIVLGCESYSCSS
jgi:hypothetical protein